MKKYVESMEKYVKHGSSPSSNMGCRQNSLPYLYKSGTLKDYGIVVGLGII